MRRCLHESPIGHRAQRLASQFVNVAHTKSLNGTLKRVLEHRQSLRQIRVIVRGSRFTNTKHASRSIRTSNGLHPTLRCCGCKKRKDKLTCRLIHSRWPSSLAGPSSFRRSTRPTKSRSRTQSYPREWVFRGWLSRDRVSQDLNVQISSTLAILASKTAERRDPRKRKREGRGREEAGEGGARESSHK